MMQGETAGITLLRAGDPAAVGYLNLIIVIFILACFQFALSEL